ncbi:MerR family transcriptional regulator [Pseudomonas sp. UBA1879]|uniref:MerR family transcriptional regulator n=1 Tax=Pseudomonas sp. UBA1879 TaxID=1947305 RepID=UPI0025CC3382|nr:MerR family transcriptional regulator [Pseudomonas sp. UBA1879]
MTQPRSLPSVDDEELLPIREVSRLTGVNSVTLRAWERRHGLITPTRTDGGHRLYTLANVETIRSILMWTERGVAISKVGKILSDTRDLAAKARRPLTVVDGEGIGAWQGRLRQAVESFDEQGLDQLYDQLLFAYPLSVVYEEALMPVWSEFVARHDAFGPLSEWLFLDHFLRGRTLERLRSARSEGEHRVLVAAMPGAGRELELWVAALLMASERIAISVLAPGQPLEELPLVCGKVKADAMVLFSNSLPCANFKKRLERLSLELTCPLLLAGKTADMAQDSLRGSVIGCLGSDGGVMRRRLQQFLAGHLDS